MPDKRYSQRAPKCLDAVLVGLPGAQIGHIHQLQVPPRARPLQKEIKLLMTAYAYTSPKLEDTMIKNSELDCHAGILKP